jgi:hypothetical protein
LDFTVEIKPTSRRALVLIAQFTQTAANRLEFSKKEPAMAVLNGIVKSTEPALLKFDDEVVDVNVGEEVPSIELDAETRAAYLMLLQNQIATIDTKLQSSNRYEDIKRVMDALPAINKVKLKKARAAIKGRKASDD